MALLAAPRLASACGGGLVSKGGTIMQAQRVLISVRGGRTEIVTEVTVPGSQDDFGVLIPLPAVPEIDPNPVPSQALDRLEEQTRPEILGGDDGGGIGCFCGGGGASKGGGVTVGPPVEIGPVTAVTLTADSGDALNGWLAANGFTLDEIARERVSEYTAPGRAFVALKRSVEAPMRETTRVGVHFTLPGDQRSLPLRFARIGAYDKVSFTIFVFADAAVAPAPPFTALTLDQLDPKTVKGTTYPWAVQLAVQQKEGKAFVLEGVRTASELGLASELARLVDPSAKMTRLSTTIKIDQLTADAHLDAPAPSTVPGKIQLGMSGAGGAAFLLFFAGRKLRRRLRR